MKLVCVFISLEEAQVGSENKEQGNMSYNSKWSAPTPISCFTIELTSSQIVTLQYQAVLINDE